MKQLLDLLFPPLCLHCRARTRFFLFCEACWQLCSPLDPAERCQHCFTPWTNSDFCGKCRLPFCRSVVFESTLPAKVLCKEKGEAIAGFAFYQWIQMQWPIPDVIVPMPGMDSIAKTFAFFLHRAKISCANILSGSGKEWVCDEAVLEERQTILLLDHQSPLFVLRAAAQSLLETSPKKIFQLSLFHVSSSFS